MYGKISQAMHHHSHFTDGANEENQYSFKCVLIARLFEGAVRDDVFSYDFCGIYLYHQSMWEMETAAPK